MHKHKRFSQVVTADGGLLQMMKLCSLTPAAGVAELARTGLRGELIFPKKKMNILTLHSRETFSCRYSLHFPPCAPAGETLHARRFVNRPWYGWDGNERRDECTE